MKRNANEAEALGIIVEQAVATLMEHCDSVQVLASYQNENGLTNRYFTGRGNFYARTGMAHEFLSRDNAENIGIAVDKERTDGSGW